MEQQFKYLDSRSRRGRGASRFSHAIRVLLPVICGLTLLAFGIYLAGHSWLLPKPVRAKLVDRNLESVNQGMNLINRYYYRKVSDKRLVDSALAGMVAGLDDRFSEYFDATAYKQFKESKDPSFSGVGVSINKDPKGLRVSVIFPHSPAERADIRRQDIIIKAGKKSLAGMPVDAATGLIKGKVGTKVTLTILRGDKQIVKTLRRARIVEPNVLPQLLKEGKHKVAVVRMASFLPPDTASKLQTELDKLIKKKKAEGIVIDLRGNGGGLINQAVFTTDLFLPKNSVVVSTRGRHSPASTLRTPDDPLYPKIPLVVLVDRDSASASEIVTAALRDHNRAKVVGQRTFGKGVFQQLLPLANRGALNITLGHYFTPKGKNLGGGGVKTGAGIKPDIKVVDKPSTSAKDEALDVAMKELFN